MNTINVSHIQPSVLLAALYNASQPFGRGFLHFDPKPMKPEEAQEILDQAKAAGYAGEDGSVYFDYLKGRVMKVSIGEPVLKYGLYDRDNGAGAAESVVASINA